MSSSCGCCCAHCKTRQAPHNAWTWRRLLLSLLLLGVAYIWPGAYVVKILLFAASYLLCGGPVLLRCAQNLAHAEIFDENFLMTLATLGAFALGEYPEAVSVMFLYQVGESLQERAAGSSRAGIEKLLSLRPNTARVIENNQEIIKTPQEVQLHQIIQVRPGERVPLDGKITAGTAQVDLSALTGESMPIYVKPGDEIWAGSICLDSVLEIAVQKNYQNSALAKILELTESAAEKKSSTEKFITRFARVYTPLVVLGAVLLITLGPVLSAENSFKVWISRALVFLVVSCPCALVLSIPLSFFGGLGAAARHGILIKGSSFLEALTRLYTLAFDKTGTLTKGVFEIIALQPQPGYTNEELLTTAAQAELHSNHPLAKAILRACTPPPLSQASWHELAGEGIKVSTPDTTLLVGNASLLKKAHIPVVSHTTTNTCVYVAKNNAWVGTIVLGDPLKPEAKKAVQRLKKGLTKRLVILSGDTPVAVKQVAQEMGIKEAYGSLLPADKVAHLEELLTQTPRGRATAFVGDGINDAPVLARADVSIAMGALGTDAAIETADVVLMTDELSKLVTAIRLARFTLHIVRQNIALALGVKGIVLVLGTLGYANLWMAVFADVGVSLLAVANSLRTLYYNP